MPITRPKYVLYADDDEDDLAFFSDAFLDFPEYTLQTFTSGIDLLVFVDSRAYKADIHLIISDINMPVMNGLQTVRSLKGQPYSQAIPAFLYSTSNNPIDRLVADSINTKMYLKASSITGLREIIKAMLEECGEPIF